MTWNYRIVKVNNIFSNPENSYSSYGLYEVEYLSKDALVKVKDTNLGGFLNIKDLKKLLGNALSCEILEVTVAGDQP